MCVLLRVVSLVTRPARPLLWSTCSQPPRAFPLSSQVINTDLSSGPTRTPVSVAGNVRRNNLGCSQPISQRTIVAGWQVPLSSTSINVFNVWSDAGHITLKGVADLLPFSDFSVGLTGNGRATFKIDADCAISPTDLFPATQ